MTIGVGEILDKYELLEMVGQGGMAVVYRGFDRSLRREVAIKVLHSHLAEMREARDRFEREAHAVAKLRHENILEIFDFSGIESSESYIVTEFIDGPTLKQFITDNAVQYPEIGAMICTQVCRALTHAHGLGILHRDVKPENIMIRNDGIVKLTDFGIAQMIDLQRMTVTGQLLGSPAYMSPEHVEGEPLDFRTDMFSVGILLYQLVTGELPFKGRNAHEILKRIADCQYQPAQQLNPLIGKELDRIINTAMARSKDDRYPDIGALLVALERYLEGSGLGDPATELEQFFAAPATYQLALRERMLDHLGRRGKKLLDTGSSAGRVEALEVFNRVLTIDPENKPVLEAIDRLSRRRRGLRLAAIIGGIAAVAALAFVFRGALSPGGGGPGSGNNSATSSDAAMASDAAIVAITAPDAARPPPEPDAATAIAASVPDAGSPDARRRVATTNGNNGTRRIIRRPPPPKAVPDAGVAAPTTRRLSLTVTPRQSQYRVGSGTWQAMTSPTTSLDIGVGAVDVELRNNCCASRTLRIPAGTSEVVRSADLAFLPGSIKLVCSVAGARVTLDDRPAELGSEVAIPVDNLGRKKVRVTFYTRDKLDSQTIVVQYRQQRVVRCGL